MSLPRTLATLFAICAFAVIVPPATAGDGPDTATQYRGGSVWDGAGFERRTLTVWQGRVVRRAPPGVPVSIVDATGRFIVPPYANAHTHVTNATKEGSDAFLSAGVFYVWNPNTVVLDSAAKAFFARADTYDVRVSQGGITEPGGHPEKLYVNILSQFVYPGRPREWFIGNAFHYGRTPDEIGAALDRLVEQKADFVKAYLVHSEDYAKRRDDPGFYGDKGMNPANLPFLVREARRRGFDVVAHVDTVADLRTAARADVKIAGHLPGYGGNTAPAYALSKTDAELVARSGMWVVPTYSVGAARFEDAAEKGTPDPQEAAAYALQRSNLLALRRAGAVLLMGTDGRGPIFGEAEHWVELGALTPRQTAQIVFATGARLFPERRIGCLRRGCEADFLILRADPTKDVRNLRAISLAVKAGKVVWEPTALSAGSPSD